MNRIFYAMVAIAFLFAAVQQVQWAPSEPVAVEQPVVPGADHADPVVRALAEEVATLRAANVEPPKAAPSPMEAMQSAILDKAKASVTLAISLIGAMAFFLGLMNVAQDGGVLRIIARLLRPILIRLFPDVPPDHPAVGAMILNMAANALGLGNAATPFGIKAIQELDKLNPHKGTATNAQALFLAINTSNISLLPTGVIVYREALGSAHPADILPTTLLATIISTTVAIVAAKTYQRIWPSAADITPADEVVALEPYEAEAGEASSGWASALAIGALLAAVPLTLIYGRIVAPWIIPTLTVGMLSFGFWRGVPVYESFVSGAKEGFELAMRIVPYLVAILCAVGMLQASGALDAFIAILEPVTSPLGLPAEALPMALLRPLSGSGSLGVMAATMSDPATGPDTYTGYLVSTLMGSTETTFYVLAVYFGAVGIKRVRHTMAAALTADLAGVAGAVIAVSLWFALA